ncbi:unnamed protein product [Gongylonema pulchrum]|uniref:Uncharacterized protein n=1 Tax=Gongylonema pulchrum TaxID=637853 RepID=A0A3P7R3D9_9BILA|nr:unnamed protein product [Gongylonema pulchrum]
MIFQAVKNSYEIYFVEPETSWKTNAQQCARHNVHSVAKEKIEQMIENFEKVNLCDIIKPVRLRINPPLFTESDDGDDVAETSVSSVSDKGKTFNFCRL